MMSSNQVWKNFKYHLSETLSGLPKAKLQRLKVTNDRKYFFDEDVFPVLAAKMGYIYRKEFLRVDFTFFSKGDNGWEVPDIFIESENNWDSCYEESKKLCSINAPLKVLIAYGFPEDRKVEIEDSYHNDYYIIQDFKKRNQLVGWYVILLYDDSGGQPKFHVYPYDENGDLVTSEQELIVFSKLDSSSTALNKSVQTSQMNGENPASGASMQG